MSRFRSLLASLMVTVMITDLVLVALACVPEPSVNLEPIADQGGVGAIAAADVSFAGSGGAGWAVQPAFLRALTRWLRNCWRGIGGDEDCRRKCFNLQSRPCGSNNDA